MLELEEEPRGASWDQKKLLWFSNLKELEAKEKYQDSVLHPIKPSRELLTKSLNPALLHVRDCPERSEPSVRVLLTRPHLNLPSTVLLSRSLGKLSKLAKQQVLGKELLQNLAIPTLLETWPTEGVEPKRF